MKLAALLIAICLLNSSTALAQKGYTDSESRKADAK